MFQTLAFVCLENLTLSSVCRSWERECWLKRRLCTSSEGGGGENRETTATSRNQPPRGELFPKFSYNQGSRLPPQAPPPPSPAPSMPGEATGSGEGPGGCRTPRLRGGPGPGGGTAFRRWLGRSGRSGESRLWCVPPLPPSPAGAERGSGARPGHGHAWDGAEPRRWPQGTPRRNGSRLWGLRLSSLPGGAERVFTPVPRRNSAFQEQSFPSNQQQSPRAWMTV